ncbi:ty3-gypsy retrotransposon protein [Cucumis melo var. makuwa]|uniref:Ty3-gypsy retrotransposon protein n=1 Tax=Cucumis melo var. makuwa TaxID=1194695 RepID=A0A5D3BZR6_CUCMM|nr:ty3-gypsy retrotransposon protein [Cucumis melo var. makuwa]TYK03569.1 ty3-gypsy retrotransposon protein [Cucumis melo var. makuwa]
MFASQRRRLQPSMFSIRARSATEGIPESVIQPSTADALSVPLRLCHLRCFLSPHPVYPTQPRTTEVSCTLPPSTCWGGDVRVQEFYGKRSRNQLSSAWVDSFGCELERDFSYISGKGFLTIGPRIKAGNVVIHMGLYMVCIGRGVMVSFIYGVVHLTDMCKGIARGRPTRGKKDA